MTVLVVGRMPFGETVTLLGRTVSGQDSDGNDVWAVAETTVEHCPVWPRTAVELVQGQDLSIVGLSALLPSGLAVTATDQVRRADGTVWEVDGEPGVWDSSLTGTKAGVQVNLRRVVG
jgi:hypothetical protein